MSPRTGRPKSENPKDIQLKNFGLWKLTPSAAIAYGTSLAFIRANLACGQSI